jgi:hypothetical protein
LTVNVDSIVKKQQQFVETILEKSENNVMKEQIIEPEISVMKIVEKSLLLIVEMVKKNSEKNVITETETDLKQVSVEQIVKK